MIGGAFPGIRHGALEAGAGTVSIDLGGTAANQYWPSQRGGRAGALSEAKRVDPALGATFTFLTYASRTGQFAIVNGNTGTDKQFTVSYTPTTATATVAAAPAPARLTPSVAAATAPGASGDGSGSALKLNALTHNAGGASFQFPALAGRKYRLEGCDDLANGQWTVLLDNIEGTGTPLQVIDPNTPGLPRYFYRIILLP